MKDMIKVEKLTKKYGSHTAVDEINLSVKRGTVFGLLGANGAGKTTTIECILGTKKADHGTVSIMGMDPHKQRKKIFQKVGVQFQEAAASLYKSTTDFMELLSEFGISDKLKSPVKELSGGQRQRLFIVLALIPKPEVVFLDELTTGLDARSRRDVWKILADLKEMGLTIFLTSHFMDEVEVLCDQICILKRGKIVFYGTVAEAIRQSPYEKFEDVYLWFTDEEGQNDENL